MKKIKFLILFVIMFIFTYLIICYLPSFRIKLFASPIEYFIESIKHMIFLKSMISAAVGLLTVGILFIANSRMK